MVEAVARLHWTEPARWSMTKPGMLWEALRASYPREPEARAVLEAEIGATVDASSGLVQMRQVPQQIVFRNESGGRLVMIGPTDLSVHALPPYEGWDSLLERLRDAVSSTSDILGVSDQSYSAVALRYINRIRVPQSEFKFSDWLTIEYSLPPAFPRKMVGFLDRTEVLYPDQPIKLGFTFASENSDSPSESVVLLDLDYTTTEPQDLTLQAAIELLRSMKAKETEAFESLIHQRLRDEFGEHTES